MSEKEAKFNFQIGTPSNYRVTVYCSSRCYADRVGMAVMNLLFERKATLPKQKCTASECPFKEPFCPTCGFLKDVEI